MSGLHKDLIDHASAILPRRLDHVSRQICKGVLEPQCIGVAGYPQRHFLTTVGSGVGLLLSGGLLDACFLHMAELPTILSPAFRRRYHVKYYGRFKDD